VAILVGWLLGNEEITVWIMGGMFIILLGVSLVRTGSLRLHAPASETKVDLGEVEVPVKVAPAGSTIPGGREISLTRPIRR
jgi:hypothetical protein